MLAPDARAVLRDQLCPPAGYVLDRAVATTFTLDLAAALVAPLAFASFGAGDTPDPVSVMEAVRSAADRVDVFCQAGNVVVPRQASDLMAFLEPMVHPVRAPRAGHLFHPKIWLLRYVAENEDPTFRLLCGTRNLTNDCAWDAVVRLDATRGRPRASNKELADFVRTLPDRAVVPLSTDRRAAIVELADDVRRLDWELPEDVSELFVHVLGTAGAQIPDFSGYRHLIVSPFVNDGGLLTILGDATGAVDLVSRVESLDRLSPDTLGGIGITTHVVSALADLGDEADSAAGERPLVGLHAKIVVVERNRQAHVFVGSMNATDAAVGGGNVEVVVELVGGYSKLGVDTFLGPGAPFRTLLEEYQAVGGADIPPDEEAARALEQLLRTIAAERFVVEVAASHGDSWSATIVVPPIRDLAGVGLQVGLLSRPELAAPVVPAGGRFTTDGLALADLTPFVVVTATARDGLTRSTVVHAELVGDPPGRLDAVLARQVDTPDKLLRFLLLVLGLGDGSVTLSDSTSEGGATTASWETSTGLFELLVRALVAQPKVIDDLEHLVATLRRTAAGASILPAGFADLWDTVREARAMLNEVPA